MPERTEQGALTEAVYYILLSLYSPMHGYAIMQNIKELSGDRVSLGAGTLYGALNTLLEKQWIESVGDDKNSRKKEYIITAFGKKVISGELQRLEELLHNGKVVSEGKDNEKSD